MKEVAGKLSGKRDRVELTNSLFYSDLPLIEKSTSLSFQTTYSILSGETIDFMFLDLMKSLASLTGAHLLILSWASRSPH